MIESSGELSFYWKKFLIYLKNEIFFIFTLLYVGMCRKMNLAALSSEEYFYLGLIEFGHGCLVLGLSYNISRQYKQTSSCTVKKTT